MKLQFQVRSMEDRMIQRKLLSKKERKMKPHPINKSSKKFQKI